MNAVTTGWNSPPNSGSSTKSSSLPSSFQLGDGSILSDLEHFEDIGLDETPDRELASKHTKSGQMRDLTVKRPAYPALPQANGVSLSPADHLGLPNGTSRRASSPNSPGGRKSRNISPSSPAVPISPALSAASSRRSVNSPDTRRTSWFKRKTTEELEKECDADADDDEVPPDMVFWNIPVSPRLSRNASIASGGSSGSSPERESPTSPNTPRVPKSKSPVPNGKKIIHIKNAARGRPITVKAMSWNDAIVHELSPEARELTEKLEAHAEEEINKEGKRRQNIDTKKVTPPKVTPVRSKTVDLPPMQISNGMIDPLPISKEKEAVLSRTRPSWLPPKSKEEEKRHLREYQKIMQAAQEAERKKVEKEKIELERKEKMKADVHRIWNDQIIPDWEKSIAKPETRELWWRGVAPRCRSTVWEKSLGNLLAVTEETFKLALRRAKELEKGKGSVQSTKEQEMFAAIRRDVREVFPDLKIFQEYGPLHQSLLDILYAYCMYRSDVGYVYGTHVIAAILLLNLSPPKAFTALCNMLNRPVPLAFYTQDEISVCTHL